MRDCEVPSPNLLLKVSVLQKVYWFYWLINYILHQKCFKMSRKSEYLKSGFGDDLERADVRTTYTTIIMIRRRRWFIRPEICILWMWFWMKHENFQLIAALRETRYKYSASRQSQVMWPGCSPPLLDTPAAHPLKPNALILPITRQKVEVRLLRVR